MQYEVPRRGYIDTIDTFVERIAHHDIKEENFSESLSTSAKAIAMDVDAFIAEVTTYLNGPECTDGMRASVDVWARPLFGLEPVGAIS